MGIISSVNNNLKELLESGKTMIVCDANVYLHIYQYTPGYCDFAYDCLKKIKDYLLVPTTISLEFSDHHKKNYSAMVNRVTDPQENCSLVVTEAESKIEAICSQLEQQNFPGVDELADGIQKLFDTQRDLINTFFEERKPHLEALSKRWDNDLLKKLFDELKKEGRILNQMTHEELFWLCKEGSKRYKKKTPPGYEDSKKDGLSKYGDLIWWKEVLKYAKNQKKDIILVTDDRKEDWCVVENGKHSLRRELVAEFKKKTKQDIIFYNSKEFYDQYSRAYNVAIPDTVQYALQITDENFFKRVNEDVFSEIEYDLLSNAIDYIDKETSDLGDKDLDDFVLEDRSFTDAELIEVEDGKATYEFRYDVTVSVNTYDFDKGIEIKLSFHKFSGTITVSVKRDADIYSDFENEEFYDDAILIEGKLVQEEYIDFGEPVYCSECGKFIGYDTCDYYLSGNGEPLCEDCMIDSNSGFFCPNCGRKYSLFDRGNSGQFCKFCEDEMDL